MAGEAGMAAAPQLCTYLELGFEYKFTIWFRDQLEPAAERESRGICQLFDRVRVLKATLNASKILLHVEGNAPIEPMMSWRPSGQ